MILELLYLVGIVFIGIASKSGKDTAIDHNLNVQCAEATQMTLYEFMLHVTLIRMHLKS